MYWFKGCPRCEGDLCEGRDVYASFIACVQCGYYLTAEEELSVRGGVPLGRTRPEEPSRKEVATAAG